MCDQNEVQYNDGDVVWVKLGPCWWPGEVHDIKKVPPEIQPGLKKPPIAFVHFFGEDKYEYVKSFDQIYHYNCRRKDEFLKKGFHAYRAKHKHMGKFPDDVRMAETLTNGDPDIMESEKYRPEEKINYRNIFASPSPKKSTMKSGGKSGRGRKSLPLTKQSSGSNYKRNSSNPYLDYDYEVHDLSKDWDVSPVTVDNSSTNVVYDCTKCNFTCTRLNVIVLHNKSHNIDDFNIPIKGKKKSKENSTNKLPKLARCFTNTIDEDLELLSKGIDICSFNDTSKRKYKVPKIKLPKTPKPVEKKKINNKKDVKGILADWDDSESEKEDEKLAKTNSSIDNLDKTAVSTDESGVNELSKTSISNKNLSKSCFDFEEEEDIATIISKSPGRKIPRVIPENQKNKHQETIVVESNDQNKNGIFVNSKDESNLEITNILITNKANENKTTEMKTSDTESKLSEIENKIVDDVNKTPTIEKPVIKTKGKRGRKSKAELEEIRLREMTKENENQEEIKDNLEKEFDLLMAETVLPELPSIPAIDTSLKQTDDSIEATKSPDKKARGRKKSESVKQDIPVEIIPEQPVEVVPSKNERRNKRKSEHLILKEVVDKSESEPEVVDNSDKQKQLDSENQSPVAAIETDVELPKTEKRGKKRAETLKEKILESVIQAEFKDTEEFKNDKRHKKKSEITKEASVETIKPNKRKQEIIKDTEITEELRRSPVAELVHTVLKIEDKKGKKKSESFLKDKSPEFVTDEKKTRRKGDFSIKDKSPEPVVEQVRKTPQKTLKDKSPEPVVEQSRKTSQKSFKDKSPEPAIEHSRRISQKSLKDKSPEPIVEQSKSVPQKSFKDKSPEPAVEPIKSSPLKLFKDKSPDLSLEKENEITKTNKRGRKKSESVFKEKSPVTILEKEIHSSQSEDKNKIDSKEKMVDLEEVHIENRSRKRNTSLKDNKMDADKVQTEKIPPAPIEQNLEMSLEQVGQKSPLTSDSKQTICEIVTTLDQSTSDKSKENTDISKTPTETIPKKSRKSRFSSIKEKDETDDPVKMPPETAQEKFERITEDISEKTIPIPEIKSPKSRDNIDKFEFIPKKTRRHRQEFKLVSEESSLRGSESPTKADISLEQQHSSNKIDDSNKSERFLKTTDTKKSIDTVETSGKYSPKKLPRREKLDEELMEYVLETGDSEKNAMIDTTNDTCESDKHSDLAKEVDSSVNKDDKSVENVSDNDFTMKGKLEQNKKIIDQSSVVESSVIPEKSKNLRKRGRPSNASKAAALMEISQSEIKEQSSLETKSNLEVKEVMDVPKEIKSDMKEEAELKSEQNVEANKKAISDSTKSDESVKVMISLNDFKMEDIPLPPSPAPKPSISNLNLLCVDTAVEHTSKVVDLKDESAAASNTSKESKEMKRTPIKFEISKMKAQINKRLITHKSFLGDEEDSLALVRKGQTSFAPEKTPVSNLKRSFNKDFIKECESPKKRVMADYKKEIDMEKNKQKKIGEKLQTEMEKIPQQEEIKKEESEEREAISSQHELSSTDLTSKTSLPDSDLVKPAEDDVIKIFDEKMEKLEEKITTIPGKPEDLSAVINSGTEIKIIDPNSELYQSHEQSEQKIVQKIVHENVAESSSIIKENLLCKIDELEEKTTEHKVIETKEIHPSIAETENSQLDHHKNTELVPVETNSQPKEVVTTPSVVEESKTQNSTKKTKALPDYVDELESIENEIQKITSAESSPCKANIFPENIALATTPTKENISSNEPILESKELYPSQLTEVENVLLAPSSEVKQQSSTASTVTVATAATSESTDNSIESEIAKLTDTKPEEGEVLPEQSYSTTSSKLLEILESKTDNSKVKVEKKIVPVTLGDKQKQTFIGLTAAQKKSVALSNKLLPPSKGTKFVIKSSSAIKDIKKKPIILSEEIIKPANDQSKTVATTPVTTTPKGATKRNFEEDLLEDKGGIKKFIIEKAVADSSTSSGAGKTTSSRAKPTVISQTIIKSTTGKLGESTADVNKEPVDDNMFDINSMPIVLSDDLLTPESIENMPIVISNIPETDKSSKTLQIISKSGGKLVTSDKMNKFVSQPQKSPGVVKSVMHQNIAKNQKIYQAASTKLLANKPAVITQPGKPEKFIILPHSSTSPASGSKYTVGKRTIRASGQTSVVVSKSGGNGTGVSTGTTIVDAKTKSALQAGNKVMVVTNSQGQQSRIILSPAQQKMLGSKMGTKIITRTTPVTKGTTLSLNNIVTSKGTILTPTSTLVQTKTQTVSPQTVITSKGQILTSVQSQSIITSKGQILTPVTPTQMKAIKSGSGVGTPGKKIQIPQKIILPAGAASKSNLQTIGVKTKTVLVKGNQKQIVQKIQPSTSNSQLRAVVQKASPNIKTASSPTVSPIISGKQKLAIAPKTSNVIKRQVVARNQSNTVTQSSTTQRVILQKMSSNEHKSTTTPQQRTSQPKAIEPKLFPKQSRPSSIVSAGQSVPPLVPLSPNQAKMAESSLPSQQTTSIVGSQASTHSLETGSVQSPKQLIIQDDMGNQTSVSQGQILAVPGGEVIDGQPQSYMLVTVDESGNLLPLDNQALMSLDPNLIGPDGNVMLQFNQSITPSENQTPSLPVSSAETVLTPAAIESAAEIPKVQSQTVAIESPAQDYQQLLITDDQQNLIALASSDQHLLMTDNQNLILDQTVLQSPKTTSEQQAAVTYSISNAEDGQQILISGDPEKAQHLINVLASGSQDLSQIMSNTEGNLIINADGQHIILNSDGASTDQIILATSTDGFASLQENYNSDFATQATTNQDILAAALANTVFPQESNITEGLNIVTSATGGPLMSTTSELSPSLYQNMQLPNLTSGAVLETSLTNLAPIMSPLEVPTSGTSKKVPLDIETTSQVPKSLELPITITDPNISQTVNSQLANELQNNLGLPITITDPNISNVRGSELNTSSFGYSLPNIEDSVETTNTTNSGPISMPLLTEDLESPPSASVESSQHEKKSDEKTTSNKETTPLIVQQQQPQEEHTQSTPETLNVIFEPNKTNSARTVETNNPNEDIENAGNALDVLASVTTASGMISENNAELEHIFAEKKDDHQLPTNVFAQNTYNLNENENDGKDDDEENNDCENNDSVVHEPFSSRSRLVGDHFVLESPHSEIDANSDEISIQPSIVTDEAATHTHHSSSSSSSLTHENSHKRSFDGLEDECSSSDSKKSKFDIS